MTEKMFSCTKCGKPFRVYPPDDMHPDAARNPDDLNEGSIKIDYTCENKHINTLYWGTQKIYVGVA